MAELTTTQPVNRRNPLASAAGEQGVKRQLTELWYLLRIEFANARESWFWSVVMASFFPLVTALFLRFFLRNPSPVVVREVITGSMVWPIIIMGISTLSQELSMAKHSGHLVFYTSLPISKLSFVVAKWIGGFVVTLPSILITALLGQLMFGITLHYSFMVLPVLGLSIGVCVSIGLLMGFLSPNHQLTSMIAQLLLMILTFMTPVYVPMSQLPKAMQYISYALPTTYVADALRTLFTSGWQGNVLTDSIVLAGFLVAGVVLILSRMDWRVER